MSAQCALLTEQDIASKVERVACEILEAHGSEPVAIVGIHTRGVIFADRVYESLKSRHSKLMRGSLDISLYRDDLDNLGTIPSIKSSDIPFPVDNTHVILFDDVLFTGRTIRAAIDVIMDYGRPAKIELAVLIDRGNRELPISADYVGETLHTIKQDHINVRFKEQDDEEGVFLLKA